MNVDTTSPAPHAGDLSPTSNPLGTSATSKMRKRTKTGCLTCRKRRIKCGEERPTCANCIKSKRQCEGYNQRVIFKTPIENWPNHASTIQYHTSMLPGTRNQAYQPSLPTSPSRETSLSSIQTRPLDNFEFAAANPGPDGALAVSQQSMAGTSQIYTQGTRYQQPLPSPHHHHHQQQQQQPPLLSPHHHARPSPTASYFAQPSPTDTSPPLHYTHELTASYHPSPQYNQDPTAYTQLSVSYDTNAESAADISQEMPPQPLYHHQPITQVDEQNSYHSPSSVSPPSDHQYNMFAETRPALPRYNSHAQITTQRMQVDVVGMSQAGPYDFPVSVPRIGYDHSSYASVQIPIHNLTLDVKYMQHPVLVSHPTNSHARQNVPQLLQSGFGGQDHVSPTQVLYDAAVENEDDDYWDVQSDEEMLDREDQDNGESMLASTEFNMIRRIHHEQASELAIRRHDSFIYDGLLTHYKPEYAASPLRNIKTARVFAHYIHVTGPSVSIYERNPRNSSMMFEDSLPTAQQSLWTYTLPLKALGNQGLLHAMLALASLQIAKLQGASLTPSYKHYAYSLKRLSRSLGSSAQRLSVSTLATSMLLAYYEVWTAEHVKWSTHLVGAAQLLTELDFPSLTREARRLKAAQFAEEGLFPYRNPELLIDQKQFNKTLHERAMMPDQNLVSTIIGKKVNYDDFGMIVEKSGARYDKRTDSAQPLDLRKFETLQDLYWWYCRHDAFQSMISGNPLILPYRKWSDCPPRAPLGRADALYGTHDHMILLLGRIADFTVRDRARKLRQADTDGGWRPRPEMPGFANMRPPLPSAKAGLDDSGRRGTLAAAPPTDALPTLMAGPTSPRGPAAMMPDFFGMAPARPHAPLPKSYSNPEYQRSPPTPKAPHPKYANLPAAYQAALEEWDMITAAHDTVSQILTKSESFAPLPIDDFPRVPGRPAGNMTPFGPILCHRSYDISIIWTLVHLAKILLLRSHPAMPAAAQIAAGVGAQAAQPYATLIGRITASMQLPVGQNLSPSLGAVLTESTLSLFFAGVQYQDPQQREWLITRLVETDRRTGWASAAIIAQGCETAWEKAAAMGRGPPYERRTKKVGEGGPLLREEAGPPTLRTEGRAGGGEGQEERGFVVQSGAPTWAINLLGTEEDLRMGMEKVGL
ncbi:hypothetical protein ACEQ8H_006921 [Pleosporales sp. CAS-2024a]